MGNVEAGNTVAVTLLISLIRGARALLCLCATGTAVLLWKRNTQFLHSAEKGGLVNTEFLRGSQAAEGVAFEGGAYGLGVKNIVGGSHIGVRTRRCAVGRQFLWKMSDADEALVAHDEGSLDNIFQFAHIPGPVVGHE